MSELPLKPIEDEPPREDRVQYILARTRRDIATKDMLTFGATRAWAGVLGIGSALLGLALFLTARRRKNPHDRKDPGGTES